MGEPPARSLPSPCYEGLRSPVHGLCARGLGPGEGNSDGVLILSISLFVSPTSPPLSSPLLILSLKLREALHNSATRGVPGTASRRAALLCAIYRLLRCALCGRKIGRIGIGPEA